MIKNLVIVQCRYNSSRLPGKALKPLSGIPILAFILRRLKNGLPPVGFKIVTATTKEKVDDTVALCGAREGVTVVRGDEDDVLKRYIDCLQNFPARIVIRVTADNPLTCPQMIQQLVADFNNTKAEYAQNTDLPHGAGSDVFLANTLVKLHRTTRDPKEREHINLHILRNKTNFKTLFPRVPPIVARPEINLSIDTEEDYRFVRGIVPKETSAPWDTSLKDILYRIDTMKMVGKNGTSGPESA